MKTKTIVLKCGGFCPSSPLYSEQQAQYGYRNPITDNGSKGVYSFLFDQQTGKATATTFAGT